MINLFLIKKGFLWVRLPGERGGATGNSEKRKKVKKKIDWKKELIQSPEKYKPVIKEDSAGAWQ